MKILMIIIRFPPALGGAEKHVYQISKELVKNNDLSVYTTTSLSSTDLVSLNDLRNSCKNIFDKSEDLYYSDSICREELIDNIKVKRFDVLFRLWSFVYIPGLFQQIKKDIKKFDIIHGHGYHIFTSIVGCYYAKKFDKIFILTAHDLIIPNNLPIVAKFFKEVYDRTFGRYLLNNSSRLIALTEDQIYQYVQRGGDIKKIDIIPNGISLDIFKNSSTQKNTKDKTLLFVGRIDEYKGIQDIIELMPKILNECSCKFIIVGKDYGFKAELYRLIKNLRLEDKIIIKENLTEDDLIETYKMADIFVFPSKMEGFGIVLLEAMSLGTLCVAYSIPSIRKVIKNGENGILVSDKSEFLEKILYYLNHPNEKAKIENNALEYVKIYDIKNIAKNIENMYMRALNENKSYR